MILYIAGHEEQIQGLAWQIPFAAPMLMDEGAPEKKVDEQGKGDEQEPLLLASSSKDKTVRLWAPQVDAAGVTAVRCPIL